MDRLGYVRPGPVHREQAREYIEEFLACGSNINGAGGLQKYLEDYPGWLDRLEVARRQVPTEEALPAETFFLVREGDGKIVGMANIRLALNESQSRHGGHIGYSIRPTERRKGYNKVNLYLALLVCQAHGIKEVLLDCDAANAGSYRTMEALGGTLVREYYDDEEDFCMTRVYTIEVDRAVETGRDVYVPQISFPFRREK